MRKGTIQLDIIGTEPNALLATDENNRIEYLPKPASKIPAALANAAVIQFDTALNYNFTLAISAGDKTLEPVNHTDGDAWAVAISGCAGQVITFGPTAGYTHRLGGNAGSVLSVTLPASGTVVLGGLRMGTTIFWTLTQF